MRSNVYVSGKKKVFGKKVVDKYTNKKVETAHCYTNISKSIRGESSEVKTFLIIII